MKRSVFFLLVVLLVSCDEEITPSQSQVTASRLANDLHIAFDVTTTSYSVFIADIETNITLFVGTTLKITADGFAEVGNGGSASAGVYNLEFLKAYKITGGNSLTLNF